MRVVLRWLILPLFCVALQAQSKMPFTVEALLKIARISDPRLSPDGSTVAFVVQSIDVEGNRKPQNIYTVSLAGGAPVQITHEGSANARPRWSADSKRLYFLSDRDGKSQIWSVNRDGSEPKPVTSLSTEAGDYFVSPDESRIVFASEVYPQCGADDICNRTRLDAEAATKSKARVFTSLLYRHWNAFQGSRRKHLLAMTVATGKTIDLTPGANNVPPFSLGGPDDFALSPDGKEVAYAANLDAVGALSTNSDIYVVPVTGGEARKISDSPGGDASPSYSPDGKLIAFRSQARAGYESDKWRLATYDRAAAHVSYLTDNIDQPVENITWAPDSSRLFFITEDRGRGNVSLIPVGGGAVRAIVTGKNHIDDVQFTADGKTMIYSAQSASAPVELFKVSSGGGAQTALTHLNDELLAQYQTTAAEDFWVAAGDGVKVQSFLVKPAGFTPTRKYPVLMLLHGGPQSAWGELFQYRWNAQVFAGAGYVVVMPNPRGSIGYGQKFTDDINADWGGKPFNDVMDIADYVSGLPYVDGTRMAAGGGSYGGYLTDWILTHTDRFRALVSHSGPFDLASSNLETEELWFPAWEFKGLPWQNRELYAKLSPASYVTDMKTPTLIMHGELDYRVPVGQSMQLFTALQVQKIPSKLVLFPDEGHWILKPQNTLLWYNTFLEWVNEWTAEPGTRSRRTPSDSGSALGVPSGSPRTEMPAQSPKTESPR